MSKQTSAVQNVLDTVESFIGDELNPEMKEKMANAIVDNLCFPKTGYPDWS